MYGWKQFNISKVNTENVDKTRKSTRSSSVSKVVSIPACNVGDGIRFLDVEPIVTGRPWGSVTQWSEYLHGMREVLGSCPGRAVCFSSPATFGGSVWVRARAARSKGTNSSVPSWFRADSGSNLIKQDEIVAGPPHGSVAQWSECSRDAIGPGFEYRLGHVLFLLYDLVDHLKIPKRLKSKVESLRRKK